jgi:ATP-dependent helicase/nuclease subunit A
MTPTKSWTPIQTQAHSEIGQSLVISAGAGSGKTSVLVQRYLNMVSAGYALSEILAVTFTDKAASEMKQRVFEALGESNRSDLQSLQISTMHSFCSRLLKENALAAEVDPAFRLLDQVEMEMLQEEILENLFEEFSKEERFFKLFQEYSPESLLKNLIHIYGECRGRGERMVDLKFLVSPDILDDLLKKLKSIALDFQSIIGNPKTGSAKEKMLGFVTHLIESEPQWQSMPVQNWNEFVISRPGNKGQSDPALKDLNNGLKDMLDEIHLLQLEQSQIFKKEMFLELLKQFDFRYAEHKRAQGFLDYEDLLLQTKHLLTAQSPLALDVRKKLTGQYRAIMIDEMQDTNPLQFAIFNALNVTFYVGDLKQSIYRFRHADLDLFRGIIEKAKNNQADLKFLGMNTNFRSTPAILNFVNGFFDKLWHNQDGFFEALQAPEPQKSDSIKPEWAVLISDAQSSAEELRKKEAAWVANKIETLIGQDKAKPGDIAILLRSMSQSAFYENALKAKGLSYQVVRAKGFFEQPEVQDLFNFLKIINDPGDDLNKMAILRSPLFAVTDQTLLELRQEQPISNVADQKKVDQFQALYRRFLSQHGHLGLANILREVLVETGYDAVQLGKHAGLQRFNNIQNFIGAVENFETKHTPSLKQLVVYLEKLKSRERFESDGALDRGSATHIQILTIHASKGLEFPVVFVADLAHGIHREGDVCFRYHPQWGLGLKIFDDQKNKNIPLYTYCQISQQEKAAELAELKRLYYVAFTRAKQYLFLSGVHKNKSEKKESEDDSEGTTVMQWLPEIYPELNVWLSTAAQDQEEVQEFSEVNFVKPVLKNLSIPRIKEVYQLQKIYDEQEAAVSLEALPTAAPATLKSISLAATQYALLPYCPRAFALSRLLKNQGHHFKKFTELDWEETSEDLLQEREHHDHSNAFLGKLVHQVVSQLSAKTNSNEWDLVIGDRLEILREQSEQQLFLNCIKNYRESAYAQIADQPTTLREQNFMVSVASASLSDRSGDQLRGTIDLAFKEHDKWVVVDYKTSSIQSEPHRQWLRRYYFGQLQAYAYALEQITGEPVHAARLVFLSDMSTESWTREELKLEQVSNATIALGFMAEPHWETQNCEFCHFQEFC